MNYILMGKKIIKAKAMIKMCKIGRNSKGLKFYEQVIFKSANNDTLKFLPKILFLCQILRIKHLLRCHLWSFPTAVSHLICCQTKMCICLMNRPKGLCQYSGYACDITISWNDLGYAHWLPKSSSVGIVWNTKQWNESCCAIDRTIKFSRNSEKLLLRTAEN